ncbi:hypothetical protein G7Y89_g13569 [Cudoniella acicularis]|uniref:SnoaL-like domain-containing protein n=1 Tax=Cudoniella acicularis TaxID=354080 RepID=A0A8H4R767_9HELO|nr:hypothetical protein G7Y89_g13569 [Cudoniella acicularis]
MRLNILAALLLAPLSSLAAPSPIQNASPPSRVIHASEAVVTPPPCKAIVPAPTEEETHARFDEFANAFLVTKNITNAFEYISSVYINHNPYAKANGPDAALDILGPIWSGLDITVLRTKFNGTFGWLNYNVTTMGEVVDRYRWEDGCIVEHWDQGEKFPAR